MFTEVDMMYTCDTYRYTHIHTHDIYTHAIYGSTCCTHVRYIHTHTHAIHTHTHTHTHDI